MDIILYTTHCPRCKVLETKLKEKKINYYICDDLNIMEDKGIITSPILDIGNNLLDFGQAIKWLKGEQFNAN